MQIGVMNHPGRDPLQEIAWIGRHGFDFVDFTLEPPAADPDRIDVDAVRTALEDNGLDVVAHTAWFLPISSPFPAIRQAALEEFRRCLRAAHAIDARAMNVHYRELPVHFTREDVVAAHVDVLQPLCEDADRLGVTIVLEHMPHARFGQLEAFVEIMQRVPLLGFHLDSGHAKVEGAADRFTAYLEKLGDRLRHVHLSDNDGTADQHLPLGAVVRNPTDWPGHIRQLKATGYDGTITLEVFADRREYLLLSRDLLRQWWSEA